MSSKPQVVVTLWRYPPEDHEAFLAAGFGPMSAAQYTAQIEKYAATFRSDGHEVNILEATVAEVVEVMNRHDLPNDPDGRANAYLILESERKLEDL